MLKNKIMVMDLDGTLLNQSKEISAENIKFIKEISKNNLIIIASGRNYKDVLKVIEKANLKQSIYKNIICSNGQLIYNIQNNELMKKNFISYKDECYCEVLMDQESPLRCKVIFHFF